MASVKIGTKAVGSVVKLKGNGVLVDYIVVHQGRPSSLHDASCDGTWLLRKDILGPRQWHSSNVNDYANSTIKAYLDSTFLNRFDADVRTQIERVKLPYRPSSGTSQTINSGVNGLYCKIFLLSDREVGYTQSNINSYIVNDGAELDYFKDGNGTSEKIAYLNESATIWWLRSSYIGSSTYAWYVSSNGYACSYDCSGSYGIRPALILPSSLLTSGNGSVNTNTAPTTPASITIPNNVEGGASITVT